MGEVELHRSLDLRKKLSKIALTFGNELLKAFASGPRLVLQRQLHVVLPVDLHLVKKLNFNIHDTTLHETLRTTLLRQNT